MRCFICCEYVQALYATWPNHPRHIQEKVLDFEKSKVRIEPRKTFASPDCSQETILNLPELHKAKKALNDHLSQVQTFYEKALESDNTKRYMDPFCERKDFTTHQGDISVTSGCVPFVHPREHDHEDSTTAGFTTVFREAIKGFRRKGQKTSEGVNQPRAAAKSNSEHPLRTMFQSLFSKGDSCRDLKQVACHMLAPSDRRYLYISQIWFLIVNAGMTRVPFSLCLLTGSLNLQPGLSTNSR